MRRRVLIIVLIVLGCVFFDRVTKLIALSTLKGTPPVSLLGDVVRLQFSENHGAVFSIGENLPERIRFWLFTVANGVLLAGIGFLLVLTRSMDGVNRAAGSLIVGGGFGNLIDRLMYDGSVIDFLNLGIGRLRTAVFNIADVAILVGALLFVIHTMVAKRVSGPDVPDSPDTVH